MDRRHLMTAVGSVLALALVSAVNAAPRTWSGSGNASVAGNWTPAGVPGPADDIVLDGTSSADLNWDAGLTVSSWTQTAAYTGTVTFNNLIAGPDVLIVAGNVSIDGGTWTHAANGSTALIYLAVSVSGNLSIGAGGAIDVTRKGFASAQGPGKGGANYGASYGGLGGLYNGSGPLPTYGSLTVPSDLGSGGSGSTAQGGGLVIIDVTGATTLNGAIVADGGANGSGNGGSASGGSIRLTTASLAGAGAVTANGGASNSGYSGGGSGGRIAITTGSATLGGISISATGGKGALAGSPRGFHGAAAGTIVTKVSGQTYGTLTVDNSGAVVRTPADTEISGSYDFDEIVTTNEGRAEIVAGGTVTLHGGVTSSGNGRLIDGAGVLVLPAAFTLSNGTISFNGLTGNSWTSNVTIGSGGVLTHEPHYFTNPVTSAAENSLNLTITGSLEVQAGGAIDVTAKGYADDQGPGAGGANVGGSYGGAGGRYNNAAPLPPYGSITNPADLGSGGYDDTANNLETTAGINAAGGGGVFLTTSGSMTINGTIKADGQAPPGGNGGSSSGGTINLTAASVAGSGTLSASGVDTVSGYSGGGGGGRIAVSAAGGVSGTLVMQAFGGKGAFAGTPSDQRGGAAGTVYIDDGTTQSLIIDNNGQSRPAASPKPITTLPGTGDNLDDTILTVSGSGIAKLLANEQVDDLFVEVGSELDLAGTTLSIDACLHPLNGPDDNSVLSDSVGGGSLNWLCPVTSFVWTGDGGDNLASTGLNWQGTVAPVGDGTEDIVLDGTSGGNPNKDMTWDLPLAAGSWDQGSGYTGTVTFSNAIAGPDVFAVSNDLAINGGSWTHLANGASPITYLGVSVGGNLTVGPGAAINADQKGYANNQGPGKGNANYGASYGGTGGLYNGAGPAPPYGSVTLPADLGSGGYGSTAQGGGLIVIEVAGSATIDGVVSADGGANGGGNGGAGAGGTIRIKADTFAGTGVVRANGGSTTSGYAGGGGGGRIAIESVSGGSLGGVTAEATGGNGSFNGTPDDRFGASAGTLYVKVNGQTYGTLTVDNGSATSARLPHTQIDGIYDFDAIVASNEGRPQISSGTTTLHGALTTDSSSRLIDGAGTFVPPAAFSIVGNTVSFSGLTSNSWTSDVTIGPGGVLTHEPGLYAATAEADKMILTINGNLNVQAGGAIDVSKRGFTEYAGIANTGGPGAGDANFGGSYGSRGGVYNNGPAAPTYGSATNPTALGSGGYNTVGTNTASGGGAAILTVTGTATIDGVITADGEAPASGNGGSGSGGTVNLTVGALAGSGVIRADGPDTLGQYSGGGGGGRIAVVTGGASLGSVSMHAYGGHSNANFVPTDSISASAGTIYTKTAADTDGILTIAQNGEPRPDTTELAPGSYSFDTVSLLGKGAVEVAGGVTLSMGALVGDGDPDSRMVLGAGTLNPNPTLLISNVTLSRKGTSQVSLTTNLVVAAGGLVTHEPNASTQANTLNLDITGDVTVQAGGAIDVTARGYEDYTGIVGTGGPSPGGANWGGSHGGRGGVYNSGPSGPTYGSATNPTDLGSGGYYSGGSANGGGAVILDVSGTLTVDGVISADGEAPASGDGGSGAGGTVNLTVGALTGSGSISANGPATLGGNSGGGGGGRIAVVTSGASFGSVGMSAFGGAGHALAAPAGPRPLLGGAAGTIYLKKAGDVDGTLIVDQNGEPRALTTELAAGAYDFDTVDLRGKGAVEIAAGVTLGMSALVGDGDPDSRMIIGAGTLTPGPTLTVSNVTLSRKGTSPVSLTTDLVVAAGGLVTHEPNGAIQENTLDLDITGDVTVLAGGVIDVSGKGYAEYTGIAGTGGPGAGGSHWGGSHGGAGGHYNGSQPALLTYDSVTNPTELGSGGSDVLVIGPAALAAGGGAVIISASGTVTVDGDVLANGQAPTVLPGNNGGSGAGGTVSISAAAFAGSGTIQANGPETFGQYSGGGGGGRIALASSGAGFGGLALSATGGDGKSNYNEFNGGGGAAGTIYLTDSSGEQLIVDNSGESARSQSTTLPPDLGAWTDDLDAAVLSLADGGNVQLTADETVADLIIAANSTLDLNGFTLTVLVCEHSLDGTVIDNGGAINWVDSTPPVITCPPDVTIGTSESTNSSNTGDPTAVENCTTASFTHSDSAVVVGPDTIITRTWTATDEDSNTDTCNQTITISIVCIDCADLQLALENELCGAGAVFSSAEDVIAFIDQKIAEIVAANGGAICPPPTSAQCRLQILQALGLASP